MVCQFPGALPVFRRFYTDFIAAALSGVETKRDIIWVDLFMVVIIDIPHIVISQYQGVRSRGKNQFLFPLVNNSRKQSLHALSIETVDLYIVRICQGCSTLHDPNVFSERIWGESFKRDLTATDLITLQEEIAQRMVGAIADQYGMISRRVVRDSCRKAPRIWRPMMPFFVFITMKPY